MDAKYERFMKAIEQHPIIANNRRLMTELLGRAGVIVVVPLSGNNVYTRLDDRTQDLLNKLAKTNFHLMEEIAREYRLKYDRQKLDWVDYND